MDPKMDPIPAPDPATPAALAPAPMYLAAESMSCLTGLTQNKALSMILCTRSILWVLKTSGFKKVSKLI